MTENHEDSRRVDELAARAFEWIKSASAADLWDVLQHGRIDARVGMPGVLPELGALDGPMPSFYEELVTRSWGPGRDERDLAAWFAANERAQVDARREIEAAIGEAQFDLGAGEWHVHTLESGAPG